ncbi:MAG: hypothetical protein U0931_04130 [Vulcanimicrobiota bacterium]
MKRRGLTVLEVLLVGTLVSLVSLLLLQTLTPCLRIWVSTQKVSQLRTIGVLAQQKMLAELRGSCEKSLAWANSQLSFLAIGQPGGYNPVNGAPIYRVMVGYWLANGVLWRKSAATTGLPTVAPFALSGPELADFCQGGKQVCADVSAFSFSSNGQHLWKLSLETREGMVTCRRESDICLRN